VRTIFNEFLETPISLTQLAKKHRITTSGIKKLLINKTYIGIVKYAGKETQGNHKPIIDADIFNKVNEKLKNKFKE